MTRKNKPAVTALLLIFAVAFIFPSLGMPATAQAASIPTVSTLAASDVDDESATLNGKLTSVGTAEYEVVEYGFYYDNHESYTVTTADIKVKAGNGSLEEDEKFDKTIGSLVHDKTYYFKAYVIYKDDDGDPHTVLASTAKYFTTDDSGSGGGADGVPEVTTASATDITADTATLNGEIDSLGDDTEITEYGFYYGTSSSPSTKKKVGDDEDNIDEGDSFDYDLGGLEADSKYYFKAYAKNSEGIAYGNVKYFTTEAGGDKPDVTTNTPTTGNGNATLSGVVTDAGDSDVKSYGFYYGLTSSPNNRLVVGTSLDENEKFSYYLTGLISGTTYYVKAYATNDEGTSYGSVQSFTISSSSTPSIFTIGSNYYTLGGTYQMMDAAPYIKNSRTYMPIRYAGYAMGLTDAQIQWDEASRMVTLTKGSNTVTLTIGSRILYMNGTPVTMDVAPEITNSRTCLPIAWVAIPFGYLAVWDATTSTVTIR